MSEMVSAAIESEKKPLNLSQVSPKAQQGWAHNYSRFNFNSLLIFCLIHIHEMWFFDKFFIKISILFFYFNFG